MWFNAVVGLFKDCWRFILRVFVCGFSSGDGFRPHISAMVLDNMTATSSSSSCVASGGHGEWRDVAVALTDSTGEINIMQIHEDIDPEGEFKVLAPTVEAPALPPADPSPLPMSVQEASDLGIILAQRYEVDEDVKHVPVGKEVLVMNRFLMIITPDQAEETEEVHVTSDQANILEQVTAPSTDTIYTATFGPLVVPPQPGNMDTFSTAPIVISTRARLVKPALEPVELQMPAEVLEKDRDCVEVPVNLERPSPAQKRQKRVAVGKEYPESLNQAGHSSSDDSL